MKKFFVFFSVLVLDQGLKLLALKGLLPQDGGFLSYGCNEAIAWSIPLYGPFFWIIWSAAVFFVFFLTVKSHWNIFLLLILSGALSNFIDRAVHGCVVDYIRIGAFPLFNLADIAITLGALLYVYQTMRTPRSRLLHK